MRINGVYTRPTTHLTWRYADPSKDFQLDGTPIPAEHKVIVRKGDCERVVENGVEKIDASSAPALPQRSINRNKSFGTWRKIEAEKWIGGTKVNTYWAVPFYVVRTKTVYQGPVFSDIDPHKKAKQIASRLYETRREDKTVLREGVEAAENGRTYHEFSIKEFELEEA
jgi:hypothetical protein